MIEVIDHLLPRTEPNEMEIKFVADGIDQTNQVLVLLFGTILVTLSVNEPSKLHVRPKFGAQLLGAQPRRAYKVRPPVIVRVSLVFFPLIHRGPAYQDDVFAGGRRCRPRREREHRQKGNEQEAVYHSWRVDYLCGPQNCASGSRAQLGTSRSNLSILAPRARCHCRAFRR